METYYLLETGGFLRTVDDVRNVVVAAVHDKAIFVRDVAQVTDGGEEPGECSQSRFVHMGFRYEF